MYNIPPPIKTVRHYRFLKSLSTGKRYGVRELETLVGCNHSPAEKRELIRGGWDIQREIITVKDRDGKSCNPSLYYLPDDWLERAKDACTLWEEKKEGGAATPPSNASNKTLQT